MWSQRVFALGLLYFPSAAPMKQFLISANCQSHQNLHLHLRSNFSVRRLTPTISLYSTKDNLCLFQPGVPGTSSTSSTQNAKSPNSNSSDQTSTNTITKITSLSSYINTQRRPLSILICWLMAKTNAVNKYAQFYLDQGYDVLTIRITPWNLIWPVTCIPILEDELLPLLNSSTHEQKVIHGFSVGGYLFGQMLKYFYHEPGKYDRLISSIKGQVWDSPVDVNGIAIGVSKSVFPKRDYLQKILETYIKFHMNVFYNVATKYYNESHQYFYNCPLKIPALFLCSKKDPISTVDKIYAVQDAWEPVGISCTVKVWDNTDHVGHMHKYPEEYKHVLKSFLQGVGVDAAGEGHHGRGQEGKEGTAGLEEHVESTDKKADVAAVLR